VQQVSFSRTGFVRHSILWKDEGLYFGLMEPSLPQWTLDPIARYLDLLDRWSHTHALTALEKEYRFEELILDSAALLPLLHPLPAGSRVVDFGTGMGIPAVLIALARPDLDLIAVDQSKKKIAFVRQAVLELGIPNLAPVTGQAETLPPLQAHAGVAKAVGTLGLLWGWWRRHGLPGAPLLALKGPQGLLEAPGDAQVRTHPYRLPSRGERVVVELRLSE
jgi:16S rRNA (guanine527-N7)-methyltransferase